MTYLLCQRKKRYSNLMRAACDAMAINWKDRGHDGVAVHAYFCRECEGYHVGRRLGLNGENL